MCSKCIYFWERSNETSIHMCLELGEELFKAINYQGKDKLFLYTSVWLNGKEKCSEVHYVEMLNTFLFFDRVA
jgi:hypothetical protein